jgi:insecticidal toxin
LTDATGGLLQLANVGFDIYQLSTAENEVERTQFGTQLAFDSASLALSVGAYVAGATTAGAVLGGASVMLGGLAVGVAALAQGFATVAEEAKQVGLFFDEVANAHFHAYQFNTAHGTWMPRPSLIVQTVDLVNAVLTMDSPKLYPLRDHFGVPTFANDYQRAIDIGRELNLPRRVSFTPGPGQAIMLRCRLPTYGTIPVSTLHGAWRKRTRMADGCFCSLSIRFRVNTFSIAFSIRTIAQPQLKYCSTGPIARWWCLFCPPAGMEKSLIGSREPASDAHCCSIRG